MSRASVPHVRLHVPKMPGQCQHPNTLQSNHSGIDILPWISRKRNHVLVLDVDFAKDVVGDGFGGSVSKHCSLVFCHAADAAERRAH